MSAPASITVLHYTGATDDRGGVMSVVHALAGAGQFECELGVSPGFAPRRSQRLEIVTFPRIDAESIGWRTFWQARTVARKASAWLREDSHRVFHAHSRAGLVVALWLVRWGEPRVVASVHCYGRQRWFYRWSAQRLGRRLFWLSPAMKRHYSVPADEGWTQCIPGCVPVPDRPPVKRRTTGDRLRLGGVGTLVPWKGWHLIPEAIASLPAGTRERAGFDHIGGSGGMADAERYAAELRASTTRQGLENIIRWRGEQASSAGFWSEIDCLVVASHNEPFSISMLEALSAGVPVLAADSGGALDLIETGRSGWFFRSGDPVSLAAQIGLLATTDALDRTEVTEEMIRPFTAPVVASQWARVYAALEAGLR